MELSKQKIGGINGKDVYQFEIINAKRLKVSISNFGATLTSIYVPCSSGEIANIVLGYDSFDEYISDPFYIGCTVGRVAGRINNGRFTIDGKNYKLSSNDGKTGNHLHGGVAGFNKKVFSVVNSGCSEHSAFVGMHYKSVDMEEGYPGNLDVWINFELNEMDELKISYKARTDQDTHVNLTNHSYFNLTGKKDRALQQELVINADRVIETDKYYIPTGLIKQVAGTPYDFTSPHKMDAYKDNLPTTGYNDYYIGNAGIAKKAVLHDIVSGRKMTLESDYPGMTFYTGDYLQGKFNRCEGVCLETQFAPDSANNQLSSTLLKPGQVYSQYTSFKFSW